MRASENRINILIVDNIVSILKLGLTRARQGFNVIAFTDPNLALTHFEPCKVHILNHVKVLCNHGMTGIMKFTSATVCYNVLQKMIL